jgi:D-glycero-alpha-D-manno-heptose-7-phosphate kinase
MIISRTPFRISLFGGGTDYPGWIREHGGAVLGMAIDKYCFISLRSLPPFFDYKHRIAYSKIEVVKEIAEIEHPAVRAALAEMGVASGIEVQHGGDLPARSGLGSSSSFTVGLLNALYAMRGMRRGRYDLARDAIHLEQQVIGEAVGCQDQVWAAYGGTNRIDFFPDGSFAVTPLMLSAARRNELRASMIFVFTGLSRTAAEIASQQIANLHDRRAQLLRMRAMVDEAEVLLTDDSEPAWRIGELLDESWQLKKQLAGAISSPAIDGIYDAALAAGASGGKLLGAGGGGFMVFLVKPQKRAAVLKALSGLVAVDVGFDQAGSQIVVYEPSMEPSAPRWDHRPNFMHSEAL